MKDHVQDMKILSLHEYTHQQKQCVMSVEQPELWADNMTVGVIGDNAAVYEGLRLRAFNTATYSSVKGNYIQHLLLSC